jgi:hypothetical protein
MAGKTPGTLCYNRVGNVVDQGTLCQHASPLPRPDGTQSTSSVAPSIPGQVKQFATREEIESFRREPFSVHSLGLLAKALSLYVMEDTTPPEERAKVRLRNLSLAAGYAAGLGQNTTKALAGDDISSKEIRAEMPGNALTAVGWSIRGLLMFREVAMESQGFRAWLAEANLNSLVSDGESFSKAAQKAFASRFSETPALKQIWEQAAQNLPNTPAGFAQARENFWQVVNNGTSAEAETVRKILQEAGYELQGGKSAPMLKMQGWDKRVTREITDRRLTIDHADPKSAAVDKTQDSKNLRFMTQRDNSFRGNRFGDDDLPR